jgi:N-acetylglutamate synthase-like GNAT family acetyltransferase
MPLKKDWPEEEITFRRSVPEDAPEVSRLFQNHLNWIHVWFSTKLTTFRSTSLTSWCIENFPGAIALADGHIVGFVNTRKRDSRSIDLLNVYVDDQYRQRGIATKLCAMVEEQAAELGITTILATATTSWFPGKPQSEGIFARLGYEIIRLDGESQLFLKRGIKRLSNVVDISTTANGFELANKK